MRTTFPSTLSARLAGGASLLALVAAGVIATRAMAQDPAGSRAASAEAAGPWECDEPIAAEPGPAFDPAAVRLMASLFLAAQETALGIRTDQMDAWRGYTTALIAFLPSGERLGRWTDAKRRAEAQAFDLAQDIASAAIERGEKARALQGAVSSLKTVLTSEQMGMARQMQARLVERIVRYRGWRSGEGSGIPL